MDNIGSIRPDTVLSMLQELVTRHGGQCVPSTSCMQAGRQKTVRTPRGTCCSKTPRPTAVFVRTDVLAIGVLRTVRAMGLRVPEDISLVSHDDVPLAQFTAPPLTTVRVDYEALGKSAVEMLAAMLERKPIALSRTVHTTLIQRATVAPPLHHTLYHD